MKIIWGDGSENHQVGKHDVSHQDFNSPNSNNQETHWAAIVGLVCGILGFFTVGITSIPAIIFSIIALSKIHKNPDKCKGKGMAIAGLVLGIIDFLLATAVFVIFAGL
jgi:hypothetical protein